MSNPLDLAQSEAVVIQKAVATGGDFLDDVEITADDFQTNEGQWAYAAIQRMRQAGTPIEPMTLGMEEPRVEVWMWTNTSLPTVAAVFHADLLHDAGVRRRMMQLASNLHQAAGQSEMDVASIIERARHEIDEAAGMRKGKVQFLGDILDDVIRESQEKRIAYPTPWDDLTGQLGGGFRPGGLYVLAARPGIGKSAIALQMAASLAEQGLVAFSSLEMPSSELVRRIIAQGAHLSHHLLERGEPLPQYALNAIDAWRYLAPASIAFDDRSSVSVSDIRANARAVKRHGELTGVVVDYLQLISGMPGASRLEIVTEVTRQLKLMARDLLVPVIALAQFNRNAEHRVDKRPALADLRDSGSIEQDADVVMSLYRDPGFEQAPQGLPQLAVPLELDVLKNRHGPTGTINLTWEGTQMRAY